MEPYKPCSLCKKNKPLTEYHKHPKGVFGRQPRCIVCSKATRGDMTEHMLATAKAYKQRPEVKAKNAQYMRERRTNDEL